MGGCRLLAEFKVFGVMTCSGIFFEGKFNLQFLLCSFAQDNLKEVFDYDKMHTAARFYNYII
jgi:hypothetical protein